MTRAARRCVSCGQVTTDGGRCRACQAERDAPRRAVYDDPRWRRLSARVVRDWIAEHGPWCPGYGRPAHATTDLTADHVIPIELGGAPFDERNVSVLCRGCNGRKRDT